MAVEISFQCTPDASAFVIAMAFYKGKFGYQLPVNHDVLLDRNIDIVDGIFWSLAWATFDYHTDPDDTRYLQRRWAVDFSIANNVEVWVDITTGEPKLTNRFNEPNYIRAYTGDGNGLYAYSTGYWTAGKLNVIPSKPNLRSFVNAPDHVKPGKTFSATYRYYRENGLGENTPPFTADGYYDGTKVVNNQIQLNPGESKSFSRTLTAPLNKTKVQGG